MAKDAQATRRRILDAAYELFYRKGFGRVGIDEIAASAGITKRTLYYHFPSKDDLLASVLDLHSELALARIRKYEDRYSGSADEILDRSLRGAFPLVGKARLDRGRVHAPRHGARRPARSPRARHRSPAQGGAGRLVGGSPRTGRRPVTLRTGARSGAPDGGGDRPDPHPW